MVKKTINKLLHEDKGAALFLVAVCLLIVFGFAAISTDAGLLYKTRRDMVAAADACALAVAQEMANTANALTLEDAQTLAESYKGKADSVTIEFVTLDNGDKAVKADVVRNEEYFFGKLISNRDNSNVVATATATWGYPIKIAGGNVLPLYAELEDFNEHLKNPLLNMYMHENVAADGTDSLPNSHWGYLDIYTGGESTIKEGLRGGKSLTLAEALEVVDPGDENAGNKALEKSASPGNKLSFTRDGIGESKKDIERSGRIFRAAAGLTEMSGVIPIIDKITVSGRTDVYIRGFAYYEIIDCVQDKDGMGINGGPYYVTDEFGNIVYDSKKGLPVPYAEGTVIGRFTAGITDIKVMEGDQDASHNFGSYYVDLIE